MHEVRHLNAISVKSQDDQTTIYHGRELFDAIKQRHEGTESVLVHNGRIFEKDAFDFAMVKVQHEWRKIFRLKNQAHISPSS